MYKIYTKNVCTPPGYIKKLLLIMKITAIFLFAALMQVSAAGLAQRLTLVKKDATLKQVFDAVNKQTNYNFIWSADQLNINQQVNADFKDTPLLEVLDKCLSNTGMTYTIEDKTVVIKKKEEDLIDKAKAFFAQVTISGKVQDETGQPLVGVTVRVKNSTFATATDVKGYYAINAPDEKAIIAFSSIGYETQELTVRDLQTGSTITLKATQTNLKEIVVSKGYYNTTQELNTGNVTRISGDDIAKQPGIDPIAALEGRVAGLYIAQTSGIPGANETVRLRGQNSINNGNDPLYIIDGVPITSTTLTSPNIGGGAVGFPTPNGSTSSAGGLSPFSGLDPLDIESIEVLKDADATAIYGSRGANGVILITTKRGKPGKTVVNINVSQGVGRVASYLDLMNTQQYLIMRHQAFKNDGKLPGATDYDINGTWDTTRYTNWQKVFIGRTAQYTNAQGSVSGGTANTQFNLGGSFNRQTTVFPGNFVDNNGTAHFNFTHSSIDQKFRANFSTIYSYDKNLIPQADFTSFIALAPDAPALYNADGSINFALTPSKAPTFNNPMVNSLKTAQAVTEKLLSNLLVSYEILPGLQLKSSLGYSRAQMNQTNETPATSFFGAPNPNNRKNLFSTSNNNTWIFEPQISYSKQISKGKLDVLVGMTQQEIQANSISYIALGFTSDALIGNPSFASSVALNGSNIVTDYRYSALYGRLSYNWEEKYLLNFTARRDGSSRFGPGNEFGNFGAVGTGWIFSKENWADKSVPWLSFGKLRASYGITGNDQIGDYQYLSTYSAGSSSYQGVSTLSPTAIANPYYGWEVNKKLEGGLELGFLKDRIFLNIDYFRNRSSNQLVGQPLPYVSGFNSVVGNLPAVVQNTGLEIQLNTTNVKNKIFNWSSSFNFTLPRNKLVAFPGLAANPSYATNYAIGYPLSVRYRYHYTGVNPQTGLYTFQDVNGDGVLDNSDGQFLKNQERNYFGGFDNRFTYKGWSLDIFFQFVKQTGINYLYSFGSSPGVFPSLTGRNFPTFISNAAWGQPGDISSNQRYTTIAGGPAGAAYANLTGSDAEFTDASFIRLKNIQVAYDLPLSWQQKLNIHNFRIFIQGQNLLTITKYQGLDPETQNLTLPPLRMITAGLDIGL